MTLCDLSWPHFDLIQSCISEKIAWRAKLHLTNAPHSMIPKLEFDPKWPQLYSFDPKSNANIYSAKTPATRDLLPGFRSVDPWYPLRFCASQTLYLLSSAPSSQLNLYPWHQWRHLSKTDDVIMMTSLTLYPQAIIFKCIKYAKCFYFSKTGPVLFTVRSSFPVQMVKIESQFFLLPENLNPKNDQKKVIWLSFDFLTISFASY